MKPDPNDFSPAASESHALEAEWRAEPPSSAREDARRALQSLAKAASENAGSKPGEAAPPLPQGLRDKWQEAYGRPQPAQASLPVRATPPRPGIAGWVAAAFSARGLAWGGGVCAAVLVFSLLLFNQGMPPQPGGHPPGQAVTRGHGGEVSPAPAEAPAVVLLAAPVEKAALKDAVASVIQAAFPGRAVSLAASLAEAEAQAAREARAVVLDLGASSAAAWAGGRRVADFSLDGVEARPETAVSRIEDADEKLDEAAPLAP